uniref:Uncharacterized protein n=1 Tax=Brassica oleracea TaxID=3712 RepID=A0A3P6BWU6_BRAOL|nr:unnamed protein product [Brassica oleracea]
MALRKHQKQPENPIGILFYVPYLSAARLRVKTAEFGPKNCHAYSPPFMVSGPFRNGAMGDVVPHGSKVMRGAKRGLPGRSPILVLLSPKHASLRSSDGIRCIGAGMIAPVRSKRMNLGPKNCHAYSPPFMVSGPFRNGAMGDVVPHGSKVMRFPSLDFVLGRKNKIKIIIKKGATTRTSGRSPILVLLSRPTQLNCGVLMGSARLRVKTAEFGPEKLPRIFTALYGFWAFPKWCYGRPAEFGPEKIATLFTALYGFWAFPKWGATRGLPGRSPILVLLSPKHA